MIDPNVPSSWGPDFWKTAHTVISAYPLEPTDEEKIQFRSYLESFCFILPCSECRTNWYHLLEKNGMNEEVLANRYTFSKWLFDSHNHVNESLGKRKFTLNEFCHQYPHLLEGLRLYYPTEFISVNSQTTNTIVMKKTKTVPQSMDTSLGLLKHGNRSTLQRMMQQQNSTLNAVKPAIVAVKQPFNQISRPLAVNPSASTSAPKPKKCGCNKK